MHLGPVFFLEKKRERKQQTDPTALGDIGLAPRYIALQSSGKRPTPCAGGTLVLHFLEKKRECSPGNWKQQMAPADLRGIGPVLRYVQRRGRG